MSTSDLQTRFDEACDLIADLLSDRTADNPTGFYVKKAEVFLRKERAEAVAARASGSHDSFVDLSDIIGAEPETGGVRSLGPTVTYHEGWTEPDQRDWVCAECECPTTGPGLCGTCSDERSEALDRELPVQCPTCGCESPGLCGTCADRAWKEAADSEGPVTLAKCPRCAKPSGGWAGAPIPSLCEACS